MSLFISYNREQKDFADDIETSVGPVCTVLRDTNDIAPWGSIEEFMQRIRQADYAVLLISDEYLKSVNCMYEASQLYRDTNWKSHTMYVVLGNADTYVYDASNHERYIRHWQDRKTVLGGQIKRLPTESVDSLTAEYKRVCEILLMLGDFLKDIRNTNNLKPDETIDAIIRFVSVASYPEKLHSGMASTALSKTLKENSFDAVFTEVSHSESLGLKNGEALRIFCLDVRDNKFSQINLQKFLMRNIGRYVFSRAQLEQFRVDDDLDAVSAEALRILRKNGGADVKGTGASLERC